MPGNSVKTVRETPRGMVMLWGQRYSGIVVALFSFEIFLKTLIN
jgi:hypothetical protein